MILFSHMSKIVLQVGKDLKNQGPQQIYASSMPFICSVETSEGAQHLGVVNHLSIGTTVTSGIFNVSMIVDLIWDYLEPLSTLIDKPYWNQVIVVINGRPVGFTKMANNIRNLLEDFDCVCILKDVCLIIRSDGGRLTVPLVDIKNIDLKCTSLNSAMLSGFVKYVDPLELKKYEYSLHPDGSKPYSLIHSITLSGTQAAVIPYLNHTHLPRNCYYAAMRKQAIGIYSMAANVRWEATTYTMPYIEKPIIDTRVGHLNPLSAEQNLMVAVLSHTGFNQENSVIINNSSIQRGMSYVFSEKKVSIYEKENEKIIIHPVELRLDW